MRDKATRCSCDVSAMKYDRNKNLRPQTPYVIRNWNCNLIRNAASERLDAALNSSSAIVAASGCGLTDSTFDCGFSPPIKPAKATRKTHAILNPSFIFDTT